jgi:hypothetical protein
MAGYWYVFLRLSEMMVWWRVLDAGLPAEDRDHRAMALLLGSSAALLAREWEDLNVRSAEACALADPHSWVAPAAQSLQAEYWSVQAIYWSAIDPSRGDRLFERVFEIETSMGPSPGSHAQAFFLASRLRRANGRDEALALLRQRLPDLWRFRLPPFALAGLFALYGDTQTALELKSRAPLASVPAARLSAEMSWAVLASVQGDFDEAQQHLARHASVARDFAVPCGEEGCLIGFAKVAVDRADYARASRLLAAVNSSVGPGDTLAPSLLDLLVYVRCTEALREILDPETARTTEAEGAALSLKEALDAELNRSETTATR